MSTHTPTKIHHPFATLTQIPQPGGDVDDISLASILNGETCTPVSFADFATYISHKEFTTENLLFIVWYRSYRARYHDLPAHVRENVPVPSLMLGDRHRPFARTDDEAARRNREESGRGPPLDDQPGPMPMREEAWSAFATFLRKGGSRELGVSDDLRGFVKSCIQRSTAPECVSDALGIWISGRHSTQVSTSI